MWRKKNKKTEIYFYHKIIILLLCNVYYVYLMDDLFLSGFLSFWPIWCPVLWYIFKPRLEPIFNFRSWCILPQSSAAFSRLFATMSSAPATSHEEVLEFWFGGSLQDNLKNKWFSAEVTPLIKERFTDMVRKSCMQRVTVNARGYRENPKVKP